VPVDDCNHTFDELAREVLPDLMQQLRDLMKQPIPMSEFSQQGIGVATLLKRFGLKSDPRACYVLVDKGRPVYVSISKAVIKRLMEHVRGRDHFAATLAYRIAAAKHPHDKTAAEAMKDAEFHVRFAEQRDYLRGLDVAFVKIANPLVLHLFEAYCVMDLDTGIDVGGWNTFRTH
jgi:hypothetical protein